MGQFINKGNFNFKRVINSDFVDKSELIGFVNTQIDKGYSYICVSRPRRFGKSLAAKMMYAYYDKSCDSRDLFQNLKISQMPSFEKHLNKYATIYLDLTKFAVRDNAEGLTKVQYMDKTVREDLKKHYSYTERPSDNLMDVLTDINERTGEQFIFIIDEWDCLVRDDSEEVSQEYVNWLRTMFKCDQADQVFALVYMTGILPIIKVETHSALNNFKEFSMVNPGATAPFYGFTKSEVEVLCKKFDMDLESMERAYDGYIIGSEKSMFNPNSVIQSIEFRNYISYWGKTASYSSIESYIKIDADNVREKIISMLYGESVPVQVISFRNDMKRVEDSDDVLTLLIHLGYLSYNPENSTCFIPNTEVGGEFQLTIRQSDWSEVSRAMKESFELVTETINMNAEYVAKAFDKFHFEASSILEFNNENSMACAIRLAYFSAQAYYHIFRELPTGKGFADMVFVPLKKSNKPAIVVEFKYDKDAEGAISQIYKKNYPEKLRGLSRDIVLVGVNYDLKASTHEVIFDVIRSGK